MLCALDSTQIGTLGHFSYGQIFRSNSKETWVLSKRLACSLWPEAPFAPRGFDIFVSDWPRKNLLPGCWSLLFFPIGWAPAGSELCKAAYQFYWMSIQIIFRSLIPSALGLLVGLQRLQAIYPSYFFDLSTRPLGPRRWRAQLKLQVQA